jgi:hypothetical protein
MAWELSDDELGSGIRCAAAASIVERLGALSYGKTSRGEIFCEATLCE